MHSGPCSPAECACADTNDTERCEFDDRHTEHGRRGADRLVHRRRDPPDRRHAHDRVVQDLEDGRAVLEMMNAAYHSARIGQKVPLPFRAAVSKPIDLWLQAQV